jgi:dimethylargininase
MRTLGNSYPKCVVRSANRIPIDLETAKAQHAGVATAMAALGIDVIVLDPIDDHPDSVFIEDAVLVVGDKALLCPFSERSRQGEEELVKEALLRLDTPIARFQYPATIDGGDCLKSGSDLFVGVSRRTNEAACRQLQEIQTRYRVIPTNFDAEGVLHLKSAASYLGNRTFLVASEYFSNRPFAGYELMEVPRDEAFASNCVVLGKTVLMPTGAPGTASLLRDSGYQVVQLDISEFIKGDGSMSCLSVIFWNDPE